MNDEESKQFVRDAHNVAEWARDLLWILDACNKQNGMENPPAVNGRINNLKRALRVFYGHDRDADVDLRPDFIRANIKYPLSAKYYCLYCGSWK